MLSEWLRELSLEQLPEPYQSIARDIGIEHTLKLADLYQGTGLYFPKLDGLLRDIRDQRIREDFDGGNYKELARKYDLTERWVYEIVSQISDTNQLSLFAGNS